MQGKLALPIPGEGPRLGDAAVPTGLHTFFQTLAVGRRGEEGSDGSQATETRAYSLSLYGAVPSPPQANLPFTGPWDTCKRGQHRTPALKEGSALHSDHRLIVAFHS